MDSSDSTADTSEIDVSIVMPCLNEARTLSDCIGQAREALEQLRELHGMTGEIVVSDNGSEDASRDIAWRAGARVVLTEHRGYGNALRSGFAAARGRFLVMGDADMSYDFREAVAMVQRLAGGDDVCIGNRFRGGIGRGSMPWMNRHLGNPVLTGILNLLFSTKIGDAHCGLRALTRESFERLRLESPGMEFASEMVLKAALLGLRIAEVPVTLSPDGRDRPPHLRPWRDGWRHLRFLLLLSPVWIYFGPSIVLFGFSGLIFAVEALQALGLLGPLRIVGQQWVILAGTAIILGHLGSVFALAGILYGVANGFRRLTRWQARLLGLCRLEILMIAGFGGILIGLALMLLVAGIWTSGGFEPLPSVTPTVVGSALIAMGLQTIFAGFLIAMVGGNRPDFMPLLAPDSR